MLVQKFGGTSVGSADSMKNVMKIVKTSTSNKIVVLSALSGITDLLVRYVESSKQDEKRFEKLILERHLNQIVELGLTDDSELKQNMIHQVNQLSLLKSVNRQATMVVGELMSIQIFRSLLLKNGVNNSILPEDYYIQLNSQGQPIYDRNESLINYVNHCDTVIAPGFICIDFNKGVSNLGRGGSDFSATCFGSMIQASRVEIWTDIDGLHQNDPRFVENTFPLRSMSFSDAEELSYFGAKILHPLCVQPVRLSNIPIHLKNTLNPLDEGTVISEKANMSPFLAVAAKDGINVVKIDSSNMFDTYGYLKNVFTVFDKYQISVDAIATSEVSISMTVDNIQSLDKAIEDLKEYGQIHLSTSNSLICVVGDFSANQSGTMSRILETVSGIPISLISYGGNERNVAFVVSEEHKRQALRQLQSLFINQETIENHEYSNSINSI